MSADHSEARERARQDELAYLEWFKKEYDYLTLGGYMCAEYRPVWLAGRRSLEQERDELRTSLTELLQFCFVKREGGQWCFKTHNGIPMGMGRKQEQIVKQAVVHKGDS